VTDPTDKETNERTDGRTDAQSVRPSLRWSLTLFADEYPPRFTKLSLWAFTACASA